MLKSVIIASALVLSASAFAQEGAAPAAPAADQAAPSATKTETKEVKEMKHGKNGKMKSHTKKETTKKAE